MGKFDVLSFYGCENEELQKEYERMFCNMTQEEKAKAYDEAVRKGLNALKNIDVYGENTSIHLKALKGIYIDLFPQIGVIDDETARLEIIEYLKLSRTKADEYNQSMFTRWIEYLEKQKKEI